MNTYAVPISVKGIVFDQDKVWLRKNERNEWELPGGKLDEGEQPEDTIARELLDEIAALNMPDFYKNAIQTAAKHRIV